MERYLTEENGYYRMDCSKAVWATDELHDVYHRCGLTDHLCDADFVLETGDRIILVEYKNATIPQAVEHAEHTKEYNPNEQKNFNKIVSKFFDSLHYLRLTGKDKPINYVFVVEFPKGNSTSRRLLRNKLKTHLPFKLQEEFSTGIKLIESVDVVNIEEWNSNDIFGEFPLQRVPTTS